MKSVACVGVGTVGGSWAALFAWSGCNVKIYDIDSNAIKKAMKNVKTYIETLQRVTGKGNDTEKILSRIHAAKDLEESLDGVLYVQESAAEDYGTKKNLFEEMDKLADEKTILATSTSGLRISEIQKAAKKHPERCITVHPFNPPHIIPLVEIVPGELTNEETIKRTVEFMQQLGKKPIVVRKDVPGMIANRLTAALWREAVNLVLTGVATPEEIDMAIKYGPALRWVVTGVFLTYHLGGGADGLKHFLESLKDSFSLRWRDLADWTEYPRGSFEKILKEMEQYEIIKKTSYEELIKLRDEKITKILEIIDEGSQFS